MPNPEVRYCTTEDGVSIAYRVEGEGPPVITMPFFLDSFSLDHLVPEIADALRSAAAGCRLIRFDTRGTGLSQRGATDMSAAGLRLDVDAVAHALGLQRFSVVASTIGTLRALDYAAAFPDRVDRLVLFGALARVLDVFPEELLRAFVSLAGSNWALAARTFADLGVRKDSEEFGLRFAALLAQSTTGEVVVNFIEANMNLDLTPLLPKIEAPTLLIYDVGETSYPVALGQKLAAVIPDVRLLTLPNIGLAFLFDKDALGRASVFLRAGDGDEQQPSLGPFRTVLFTDLVGHTEMMQRLGDEQGRALLREHERITRDVLKQHSGEEIKTMGDGFMASFASVTKAVECAIALQRSFEQHNASITGPEPVEGLHVRVGLNAGEPIEEDGDLFGSTVILASRICAQAGPGEILVPDPVRHLLSGKDFLFSDRGDSTLKGFEDPLRLYEVRWRG